MSKLYLFACCLLFVLTAPAQSNSDTTILQSAEQLPVYPGGTDSLIKDITAAVVYPKQCADSGIQGKVYLRFVVNTDGSISNIQAIKSPHPLLSAAASEAVKQVKKFTPAIYAGKPVRIWFSAPVNFKIKTAESIVAELKAKNPGLIDSLNAQMKELEEAKTFTFVEQNPRFPGGDKGLIDFVMENLNYPQLELENDISGKVLVRFVVDEEGLVSNASVIQGVSPGLDKEALRIVNLLPRFTPGTQQGKPVKVYYNLPIVFKLGINNGFEGEIRKNLYEYYTGGFTAFCKYMQESMVFPEAAKKQQMEAQLMVDCRLKENLQLEPVRVLNDIDSVFTEEAFRLIRLSRPFNEEIRKSSLPGQTVRVTLQFVFDKRHQWDGAGGSSDRNEAMRMVDEGAAFFKQGKYEKAIDFFDAAIRKYSIYPDAFYNRALCYLKQNNNAAACDDFKRAYLLGTWDAKKGIEQTCK